jgi:hypothetical protein
MNTTIDNVNNTDGVITGLLDRTLITQLRILSELDTERLMLIITICLLYIYVVVLMYKFKRMKDCISNTECYGLRLRQNQHADDV